MIRIIIIIKLLECGEQDFGLDVQVGATTHTHAIKLNKKNNRNTT